MVTFPRVVEGESIDVSATTYVAFRQCPESAAARLRGEYGPDSTAGFRGGLSHRIFARHLRDGPIEAGGFQQACREEIQACFERSLAEHGLRYLTVSGSLACRLEIAASAIDELIAD